jgi:hypothetical protein
MGVGFATRSYPRFYNERLLMFTITPDKIEHKIMVGINVLTSVMADSYVSHMNFIYRCAKHMPTTQFFLHAPQRMTIDNMRNHTAKVALANECDYLCFIDDDVMVEPLMLKGLIEADKDIVMAETYIRGYPYDAMFFKFKEGKLVNYNEFKSAVGTDGLVEVDAVGFSAVLIKCSFLKQLSTPYFVTGPNFTEDVYFCLKAVAELGRENVSMFVDTKYPTAHRLNPEYITAVNRDLLKKFQEDQMDLLGIPWGKKENVDRGDNYMQGMKNLFGDAEVPENAKLTLP